MDQSNHSHGLTEIIVSVASVAVGLIVLLHVIPEQVMDPNPSIPNAKTFPYIIVGLFTLLCCRWVFNAIRVFMRTRKTSSPALLFIGLGVSIFFFLTTFLIGAVGYYIGGILATFIVIVAIDGMSRWLLALIASVAITVGFAFFFGMLHIEIPVGSLNLF
jgi:ABC-type uncharacterized transport system permease subunit